MDGNQDPPTIIAEPIAVAGPGRMGSQIGSEFALHGCEVFLLARDKNRVALATEEAFGMAARYELVPKEAVDRARDALRIVARIEDLPSDCSLIIESLPELMGLKVEVLESVVRRMPAAVVASNTSSLSITRLANAIGRPSLTVGAHYWNPPLLMPLVEIVGGESTDPAIVEAMTAAIRYIGKTPVDVRRDVPGFIWNRLQFAVLREALQLVEAEVATPETIDLVLRDGLARRWISAPLFASIVVGGLETWQSVAGSLFPELSQSLDARGLGQVVRSYERRADDIVASRNDILAVLLDSPDCWAVLEDGDRIDRRPGTR